MCGCRQVYEVEQEKAMVDQAVRDLESKAFKESDAAYNYSIQLYTPADLLPTHSVVAEALCLRCAERTAKRRWRT